MIREMSTSVDESFIAVPGARLYLREVGTGTPIVVLHGGPDFNHSYLLPEMDGLAESLRLVYYDQRGRGKSSAGVAPEDVTIGSEIEDLDRVREHLGVDRVTILGHSWGSLLAMEYAARHPERVSHLILMNSAPASHADMLRFRAHREADHPERLAAMREIAAMPVYAEGDIETEARYYRFHFGATLRQPEMLDRLVGRLRTHFTPADVVKARVIENRLYEQTWLQPGYDVGARLAQTGVPVLVIHGEFDFIPEACARGVAGAAPNGRFTLIPDCGHFSYMERPAETFAAIEEFLR